MLLRRVPSSSSPSKGLYNPKAFITHAASLDQGCPHCPRFPTAASRRSLGRVSVPVWLIVLSDQLPITALVGRYPTNQLIGRGPLPSRPTLRWDFGPLREGHRPVLAAVSRGCPGARGRFPRVTHPSATRIHRRTQGSPFDLHVLGAPPAFVLSQDQTLSLNPRPQRQAPLGDGHPAPTASLHKAGPPGPRAARNLTGGARHEPPKGLLKGDRLETRAARSRRGAPERTPRARPRAADLVPPPSKMPEPHDPTRPPPTHPFLRPTCPKNNATGSTLPPQTQVQGRSDG